MENDWLVDWAEHVYTIQGHWILGLLQTKSTEVSHKLNSEGFLF